MTSTADLICLPPSTLSHPSILTIVSSYMPHHDTNHATIATDQMTHELQPTEPLAVS